jgi:N4-gp56 family major capsid protein
MTTLNTNTTTEFDYAIQELWEKKLREDTKVKEFWGKHEGGEGSGQPIINRNDFTKSSGDIIRINTMSELGGAGVTGNSTLQGNEEKLSLGQITVIPDWIRHGVSWDKKANKAAAFDAVLAANPRLSRWLARKKDNASFKEILDNTTNKIYAGPAVSSETIGVNSTFGVTEIDKLVLGLKRQGAMPIEVRRKGKSMIEIFGIVMSEMDYYNLWSDSEFVDKVAESGIRGEDSPTFTSAVGLFHGALLYVHHGIGGHQGTPLRPEASIYGATNTAGAVTITVGVSTAKNYTEHFPAAGTISIVSKSDKTVREFVTYTSKTANTFAGCTRGVTYGDIESSAVDWSALDGSLITLNNHESTIIGFGSEILARSWSQYPQMKNQTYDYEFETGVAIEACWGQSIIKDSAGKTPNSLLCKSYGLNPNQAI